jgi:tetratricopeptide (TPR) repeat protein
VGDEVRINAQLIDATTGGHLWAERYDGTLADVFDLQDKVTERIVAALALQLTPQEAQRVGRPGTDDVAAHDAYLLGLTFYYRRTPESFAKAKTHFERAIELDTSYSAPHTALAKMYAQSTLEAVAYPDALGVQWRAAGAKARKSLAKVQGQPNAGVHVVRSWLALKRHQHRRAITEAELAVELSPNDVDALDALAKAHIYAGHPKAGIVFAEKSMRQNPVLVARPLLLMGLAEFALGNPGKAIEHIERAFELGSEEIDYAGVLAASYGELGRIDQAKAAFEVFQHVWRNGRFGSIPALEWTKFRRRRMLEEAVKVMDLIDPDSELITLVDVTPVNRTRNFHNFSLETPEFFDDLFLRLTNDNTPRSRLLYQFQTPDGAVYWILTRGR